jgi:hypothetical protein
MNIARKKRIEDAKIDKKGRERERERERERAKE